MEDLKEMFATMMKFQMESQQKKWGKTPSTSERILKNEEKQQQLHKENKKES